MAAHGRMFQSIVRTKPTCTADGHERVGMLPDVRVLAAPRHPHQYVIDEIERGGAVDVPLERGQHQQLPVLCAKEGRIWGRGEMLLVGS